MLSISGLGTLQYCLAMWVFSVSSGLKVSTGVMFGISVCCSCHISLLEVVLCWVCYGVVSVIS